METGVTRDGDAPPAGRSTGSRRLRTLVARVAVLGLAVLVAAALAEAMVRLARPGFPGFRVPQIEHRPVDGLGFEMIPNQAGYTTASKATVNSEGFRGPEIRAERLPGDLRVLCLGDSITFGVGVQDEDPYPRQLEALLASAWPVRRPEVINAGVQRYFTYQEIDQLTRYGRRLGPDIVSLGMYPNDIAERPDAISARDYDNEREQAAASFRRRMPLLYNVVKNSAAAELAKHVYLSRSGRENMVVRSLNGIATERDEGRWSAIDKELESFARLAAELQFAPIVVTVPARAQITQDMPHSLYPARILDTARRLGLPAVNPETRFKESLRAGADPYLPWDDHLSRVGHTLVAHALQQEIDRLETVARSSAARPR